jgi:hypothetical protein
LSNESKLEALPVTTMFVNGSRRNEQYLKRTLPRRFLPKFGSF